MYDRYVWGQIIEPHAYKISEESESQKVKMETTRKAA